MDMKTVLCFTTIVLYGLVRPDGAGRRQKRYLAFEMGSSLTVQGNMAKSIVSGTPRGLNEIAEYTLVYDLPTGLDLRKHKETQQMTTTTTTTQSPEFVHLPYQWNGNDRLGGSSKYLKCVRWNFYEYRGKTSHMCLKRTKRVSHLQSLSTSQRMFYDILEKWSHIHGFLPRYCFMRTLCEARHILHPPGYSLLHDVVQILVSYTEPWAFHHRVFGGSLKYNHSMEDCAKLYGPHCRVSWLSYVTRAVHGSRADFVH